MSECTSYIFSTYLTVQRNRLSWFENETWQNRDGDSLFMFQYLSNKMQRYTVYLYLETALHVSGLSVLLVACATHSTLKPVPTLPL